MMNKNLEFENVLSIVKKTLSEELSKYSSEYYTKEIIIDNEDCLRVVLEWQKCMGELIVEEPEFAPYRYVSFNILSTDTKEISSVFFWCDTKEDSITTIEKKVRDGIEAGFNYCGT